MTDLPPVRERQKPIKLAYFSLEIMLRTHIPTYAGGLGILAGDLLRSCADMRIPAVGVTLVYNGRNFNQVFQPDGTQTYEEVEWRKNDQFIRLPETITLKIDNQDVKVGVWRYDIVGYDEFVVPVFLLDTDHIDNEPWKKHITDNLYGGEHYARVCQEIVLGIGGVKMLRELGYFEIEQYHMNEGHACFVPLGLLPEHNYNDDEVRRKCVFTTHTPIPEGHDIFSYEHVQKYAQEYLPWHIKKLATEEAFHTTHLAMNMSHYTFGVSQKHGEVTRHLFPGKDIHAITNGVHHRTWTCSNMQDLYNKYMEEWNQDPSLFTEVVHRIPGDELWRAHQEAKKILVNYVNKHLTSSQDEEGKEHPVPEELFDTDTLTIALARRPVPYKRPLLVYSDLNRLIRLGAGRLQIIQSGKSHPDDKNSQAIVSEILKISKKLKGILRIVYLENYSPKIARLLTSGCDVWLNTPRRPLEASGTSGMKAAMNGVLNFSVLDGWWIEGFHMAPQAGWSIGPLDDKLQPSNDDQVDSDDLYRKLENEILPLYYNNRTEWITRMKHAITLGAYFNTHRCMKEYQEKAYRL
ncbi:MAG: alpha-glucan family phosphorylase [Patescibacteria group bacterium]|nr:alpha-glucan family phosphorylase [Patescibacteria group bacterium]